MPAAEATSIPGTQARYAGLDKEADVTETIAAPPAQALKQINHWIGGRAVAGGSGRQGAVYNPATGRQAAEVDFATTEEVDAAVQAAKAAFVEWRNVSLAKRAELFFRIRELVHERKEEVAKILVAEHGKVLSDALGEVTRGLEVIEYCCGLPTLLKSEYSEQASTGIDVYSIRQPLGVVAGITPFNFPAMVPMWMWAPALACGNTFVLKPSEKDPSASVWTAELLKEAGLPDGVFNVVHGDKTAVDAVLTHPDIAAVSFVGSTPIARYVYETATSHGKRCQALGGAKNHMIVLPDADVAMAADAAVSAAYGSAGERCMAISQVVAVGHVADELIEAIKARIPKVKVGDGMDPASEMGPLVTREHRDKVASYVENAPGEGAAVLVDGREGAPADGFFLKPSLLDNVKPGMKAYEDEIFGPVLGVTRVDTYDEAVRLVNENPYGNGTAIFTRDGGVARQFQFDVQAGMVGINVPIPVPVAYHSFGGWKASLFGDRHIYGPEGIEFYTRGKVVTSRWPDPATSKVDLGFPQTR
jgi:malonate-semialdehyde dehydrogenase (acetylating) / methylmalonate-semialdehyde dehydrogenase